MADTDKVACPLCVTVIFLEGPNRVEVLTVIVPFLSVALGFFDALIDKVEFFVPLADETFNQLVLLVAVQEESEVTFTGFG